MAFLLLLKTLFVNHLFLYHNFPDCTHRHPLTPNKPIIHFGPKEQGTHSLHGDVQMRRGLSSLTNLTRLILTAFLVRYLYVCVYIYIYIYIHVSASTVYLLPFPALLLSVERSKKDLSQNTFLSNEGGKREKRFEFCCRWICSLFWWRDTRYANFAVIEKGVCLRQYEGTLPWITLLPGNCRPTLERDTGPHVMGGQLLVRCL